MMTMTLGLNKHMKIGGRLGCNAGRLADKKGQEKNVNDHNEDDWKCSIRMFVILMLCLFF